jgi:hypothetical protein
MAKKPFSAIVRFNLDFAVAIAAKSEEQTFHSEANGSSGSTFKVRDCGHAVHKRSEYIEH